MSIVIDFNLWLTITWEKTSDETRGTEDGMRQKRDKFFEQLYCKLLDFIVTNRKHHFRKSTILKLIKEQRKYE